TLQRQYQVSTKKDEKTGIQGEKVDFPGAKESYFTDKMQFIQNIDPIPTYRVMNRQGKVMNPSQEPQ
ncbi:14827_t:CDS:1, partial [Acaulospora colombiana]